MITCINITEIVRIFRWKGLGKNLDLNFELEKLAQDQLPDGQYLVGV